MKKNIVLFVGIAAIAVTVAVIGYAIFRQPTEKLATMVGVADPKNATYVIEGQKVKLVNGLAQTPIVDSSSISETRYFGNDVVADLNGDGIKDVAFVLTQQTGGSGTFFYAAALLSVKGGFVGSNAILLGDRIAPQTTEFKNGQLIVNYADRKPSEPMTATPSVGVSKYITVRGTQLK